MPFNIIIGGIYLWNLKLQKLESLKLNKGGALLGYANIVINDCFIIRGIRILENQRTGRFVAMPSRRLPGEKRAYKDLCHPLNQEVRTLITKEIFNAYDKLDEE